MHNTLWITCMFLKDQCPVEIIFAVKMDAERQKNDDDKEGEEDEEEEEEDDEEDEDEEECSVSVEAELACMEEKWREQCTINENLKLQLANEEKRFKVRKHTLAQICMHQVLSNSMHRHPSDSAPHTFVC